MKHNDFLKKLLSQGATYFGVLSLIIVIVFVPLFKFDSVYISAITYFAGMFALYLASYKVWLNDHVVKVVTEPKIEVVSGVASFVSGTGKTFNKSTIVIDLCFINASDKSVSFGNFSIISNLNSPAVTLDTNLKFVTELSDRKFIKSVDLKPNESKSLSVVLSLQTTFKEPLETAKYLNKYDGNDVEFHFESIADGTRVSSFVKCPVSLEPLKRKFNTEWKNQREIEALEQIA